MLLLCSVLLWNVRQTLYCAMCTQYERKKKLETPDNLRRWGHLIDPKCKIEGCGMNGTLGHLLNSCAQSLDRFKYRHDGVLSYLLKRVTESKPESMEVYCDLE